MTSIQPNSYNVSTNNNVQQVKTDKKTEQTEKKEISTGVKVGIGAVALAVSAVAGIAIHNKVVLNKAINTVKKDINQIIKRNEPMNLNEIFDNKILQGQVDEVVKLPKKEQLQKLTQIKKDLQDTRGLDVVLYRHNNNEMEALPQVVKDAIAEKDQLKAYRAYAKHCDNLFIKSKTAGSTIQESVENVFGKGTTIKPHTYDVSKEADRIGTSSYTSGSGYLDVTVKSDNQIVSQRNHKNIVSVYSHKLPSESMGNGILKGVTEDGKPFVEISYIGTRDDTIEGIMLLSPDKNLTPAQKDLLKLKDAKELPFEEFRTLTADPHQTNYDAILSLIQTEASKI